MCVTNLTSIHICNGFRMLCEEVMYTDLFISTKLMVKTLNSVCVLILSKLLFLSCPVDVPT